MENKYYALHHDVLEICRNHHITVYPGKVISNELLSNHPGMNAPKDIFVKTEDFNRLETAISELAEERYIVEVNEKRKSKTITIYRKDIFAGNIAALMSGKYDTLHPKITIREVKADGEEYKVYLDSKVVKISRPYFDQAEAVGYMGSLVYVFPDMEKYMKALFGKSYLVKESSITYRFFEENLDAAEVVRIAKERGYISDDNVAVYAEHRRWVREEKTPVSKLYGEYEKTLLGLEIESLQL